MLGSVAITLLRCLSVRKTVLLRINSIGLIAPVTLTTSQSISEVPASRGKSRVFRFVGVMSLTLIAICASISSARAQSTELSSMIPAGSAETSTDSTSSPLAVPLAIPKPVDASGRRTAFSLPEGMAQNTMLALMVVVGLFLVVAWVTKRAQPRSMSALPKDAVELLGRTPIDSKQYLQLVRFGRKLVLVNVGAHGVSAVSEIEDPAEVEHVLMTCRSKQTSSSQAAFREAVRLEELAPASGFLGGSNERETRNNRRRVWSNA